MDRHRSNWCSRGTGLACAAAIVLLTSCSKTPAEADPNAVPGAAYPTAQSVVDRFNQVTSTDPFDFEGLLAIFHPESLPQRRWRAAMQISHPIFFLSTEVRRRFGEEIIAGSDFFTTLPNGAATLDSTGDDRAEGTYLEVNGVEATLYLVRINDNWWVSGATYEQSPYPGRSTAQVSPEFDEYSTTIAFVAPGLRRRVEAEEFKTIAEFRLALEEALRARERGR